MKEKTIDVLMKAIRKDWTLRLDQKAKNYVDQFYDRSRSDKKISAKVEGNHGIYRVSIIVKADETDSACSCYIGRDGGCHHCEALAVTFLKDPASFKAIPKKTSTNIKSLADLEKFLKNTTLDKLLTEMKTKGINHKDFADSIGMNPRHLSSINSCEKRNMIYNELGATKLACLWVLDNMFKKVKKK